MNKKHSLASFALLVGLLVSFTPNVFAQKINSMKNEKPSKQCTGEKFIMPQSVVVGNESLANFIKVMSQPDGERQKIFSEMSNQEKANVYRVKIALEFIKRPNLTKEQKNLILDSISLLSAETYNKKNPELAAKTEKQTQEFQQKALSIFPSNDFHEIYDGMNGKKEADVALLTKYEEKLTLPMNLRREALRKASPAERSDFWKAQMIYHLVTAKLSKEQFEFIAGTIPLLTVKAFDLPKTAGQTKNEETLALDSLESKALELFSKEELFAIFTGLGLQREVAATSGDGGPYPAEDPLRRDTCTCNVYCDGYATCEDLPCNSGPGCGIFGNVECTGGICFT